MMTNDQHKRAKDLFIEVQDSMSKINVLIKELCDEGYDPADNEYRDALYEARNHASESRLHLLDAYDKVKAFA